MEDRKSCPFYRIPDVLTVGKGVGYCDLHGGWAICEGDILYCEKRDTLAAYLGRRIEERAVAERVLSAAHVVTRRPL